MFNIVENMCNLDNFYLKNLHMQLLLIVYGLLFVGFYNSHELLEEELRYFYKPDHVSF